MAEKDLSHTLMKALRREGHAVRVENMVEVGTPDVNYCVRGVEGWIENKWRAAWPRDPADIVTLDHFTPQQRIWLRTRAKAGGRVFVCLQVGREYLLLSGKWSADFLGKVDRREIMRSCLLWHSAQFPAADIIEAITK